MIKISVPDSLDSLCGVTLGDTRYYVRFSYNFDCDYWTYGLYNEREEQIYNGIKIVPNYFLNPIGNFPEAPEGYFLSDSALERIGRNSFKNEEAQIIFIEEDELVNMV